MPNLTINAQAIPSIPNPPTAPLGYWCPLIIVSLAYPGGAPVKDLKPDQITIWATDAITPEPVPLTIANLTSSGLPNGVYFIWPELHAPTGAERHTFTIILEVKFVIFWTASVYQATFVAPPLTIPPPPPTS